MDRQGRVYVHLCSGGKDAIWEDDIFEFTLPDFHETLSFYKDYWSAPSHLPLANEERYERICFSASFFGGEYLNLLPPSDDVKASAVNADQLVLELMASRQSDGHIWARQP